MAMCRSDGSANSAKSSWDNSPAHESNTWTNYEPQRFLSVSAGAENGGKGWGHLGACVDLSDEEVDADVCDAREELLALLRVLEQPRLGLLERFGPASLYHVREQRPRRATEPDERDRAREPVPRSCDGREDVAELLVHVNVLAQARDIRGRVERGGERRRWVHEDLHAHGLRDHEDVAEDDGGVEQARIPPDRLERDLAREGRRAADLEKLVLRANCAELCQNRIYQPTFERAMRGVVTCLGGSALLGASPRPVHARFLRLGE